MTDINTFNFENIGQTEGTTVENALEATAKANDIFGETLQTTSGSNDILAQTGNIVGEANNTNTFNGEKQLLPGTTIDTDQFFKDSQKLVDETINANALLKEAQKLPGTTIDADELLKKNAQNLAVTDTNALFTDAQTIPATTNDTTTTLFGTTEAVSNIPTATTDNTFYGTNPTIQGTFEEIKSFPLSKTHILETNQNITTTETIPSTTEFYGTTQIMPETTNFISQTGVGGVQKITTTTTKTTTYNTNQNLTNVVVPTTLENIPPTIENIPPTIENIPPTIENIPPTLDTTILPRTQNKYTQTTFSITGIPSTINSTTYSNLNAIGYGTTAEPILPMQSTTFETTVIPTTTENIQPIQSTTYETSAFPTTTTETVETTQTTYTTSLPTSTTTYVPPIDQTTIYTPPVEQTTTTTSTTVFPQTQTFTSQIKKIPVKTIKRTYQTTQIPKVVTQRQVAPTYVSYAPPTQSQVVQINQPASLVQTRVSSSFLDEDFRRGRPIYSNTKITGSLLQPNNLNMSIRPSYNVALENNPKFVNYSNVNTGMSLNPLANSVLANSTNLDRLGRGRSYDLYGRNVNPLYNRVGLTPVTNNLSTSKIKDFL